MKRHNLVFAVLGVVIVIGLVVFGVYFYKRGQENTPKTPVNTISEVGKIEGFDYKLEDRDTKLFKDNFSSLKKVLESEVVDYEEYAKIISKMYIIDLYTISNKINQYDVGGLEYVHPDAKDNFDLKVRETIYRFVEDDTYGKRAQSLPEVLSIEVDSIEEENQQIGEDSLDGYTVDLSWEYIKDLGYDKTATLKLVKVDKMLYIIKHTEKQST